MPSKLKIITSSPPFDAAAWEARAACAAATHPLKHPTQAPNIPGITSETARHLKWKSLRYLIAHDRQKVLPRYFFKRPFRYLFRLIKSWLRKKSHLRDGDFFLYNCKSVEAFKKALAHPESLLVLGFSYCHKPHECPSSRFSSDCIHDPTHPVCQQCFIGKAVHAAASPNIIPLFIPTIHYIGEKIFEIVEAYPKRPILFIITACELTLEMFGDWGNMVDIQGIGVRLDGRICNTFKAFELSEEGIKPGLTWVLPHTQERILDLLRNLSPADAFSEKA